MNLNEEIQFRNSRLQNPMNINYLSLLATKSPNTPLSGRRKKKPPARARTYSGVVIRRGEREARGSDAKSGQRMQVKQGPYA